MTNVSAYTHFWQANRGLIETVYRPGTTLDGRRTWDEFLEALLTAGIIGSREPFDRDFVETNRNKADVRPGLEIFREWSLEAATELDETAALRAQLQQAYEQTLTVFDQTPALPAE